MNEYERTRQILAKHNIRIKIGGCGCCGSPWLVFEYKGELIIGHPDNPWEHAEFDMFEVPKQPLSPEPLPKLEERDPSFIIQDSHLKQD